MLSSPVSVCGYVLQIGAVTAARVKNPEVKEDTSTCSFNCPISMQRLQDVCVCSFFVRARW